MIAMPTMPAKHNCNATANVVIMIVITAVWLATITISSRLHVSQVSLLQVLGFL